MKVVGLTGGIATGKSQAASMLVELGAVVIDADIVAREIVRKNYPAWRRIKDLFGEDYLLPTGEIDRKKLGELVFSNADALKILNDITHTAIKDNVEKKIGKLKEQGYIGVVVVEAALLIEKGWESMVDEVWVVDAPMEQRIERLIARDNLSRGQALNRVNSQMDQQEKIRKANRVIYNKSNINDMRKQVEDIWNQIQNEIDGQ